MIARLICGCLCGAARTMVATSDSLSRKSSIPDSGLSCLDLDGGEARSGRRMTSELPAPIFILQNWITHACLQSKEARWHMWEVTFTLLSCYSVIPGIPCDSCVSWGSLVNCPTRWSLSLIFGFLWWSSIFLYPEIWHSNVLEDPWRFLGISKDFWIFRKGYWGFKRILGYCWSFVEKEALGHTNNLHVCLEDFPHNPTRPNYDLFRGGWSN